MFAFFDVSNPLVAWLACRREEAGFSLKQFAEAAETHFTYLSKIESGRSGVPQLALILRLAGSLNVRCGLITAGIVWNSASGLFEVEDAPPEPQPALIRLGQNVHRARHKADLSQQALSDLASMNWSDLVDFERGAQLQDLYGGHRLAGPLGSASLSCSRG